MRGPPIKEPRRIGAHVDFAINALLEFGAANIRVFKTRHLQVVFDIGPHELTVHMACTPTSVDDAKAHFRQELTRVARKALGRVRI